MTNTANRAESLNQYLADVNAGTDSVVAWRQHKTRMGELEVYESRLLREQVRREKRKSDRKAAGCAE